jgi:hypothetical protein
MRASGRASRITNGSLCVLALGLCLLLGACSGGGVPTTVLQAVDDGISAVGTARLATAMDSSGQLTDAAASTALVDALTELGKARTTVVQLSPAVQEDRELRGVALAAMDDCTSAMLAAAEALSSEDGHPSLADAQDRLESAGATLSDLKNRLGGS